ncbi:MAG: hemerythrin domain-containing protein, partial [Candidatus Omnitrophica bacterium]|nr:hemerythrin domain-containing protein [Candidatus Omnitrophota bacterium]
GVTIVSYMEADHDRLDEFFAEFQKSKREDLTKAKGHFKKYHDGFRRHLLWEEEVLFPVFEAKAVMDSEGPTVGIREEHRLMEGILETIHRRLQAGDIHTGAEEAQLIEVMSQHKEKEVSILYLMIVRLLTEQERKELFQKLARITEKVEN